MNLERQEIHPLNPGCIKNGETAPCLVCDHDPVTSTSDADTSGSLNSLETHATNQDLWILYQVLWTLY